MQNDSYRIIKYYMQYMDFKSLLNFKNKSDSDIIQKVTFGITIDHHDLQETRCSPVWALIWIVN